MYITGPGDQCKVLTLNSTSLRLFRALLVSLGWDINISLIKLKLNGIVESTQSHFNVDVDFCLRFIFIVIAGEIPSLSCQKNGKNVRIGPRRQLQLGLRIHSRIGYIRIERSAHYVSFHFHLVHPKQSIGRAAAKRYVEVAICLVKIR